MWSTTSELERLTVAQTDLSIFNTIFFKKINLVIVTYFYFAFLGEMSVWATSMARYLSCKGFLWDLQRKGASAIFIMVLDLRNVCLE